jgi:uncharacterized protein
MRRPARSPKPRSFWRPLTFAPPFWRPLMFALLALAGLALWVAPTGEEAVRYTGVARIELPLPAMPAPGAADSGLPRSAVEVGAVPLDITLTEEGPFGPLPRIGPDGRRPFFEYARAFDFADARPKVAVLLPGLGLEAELFEAALALPGPVSLQVSPYAPDLPALVERARRAGHEVLLDLPMEPADYPTSDPGPHTLLADNSRDENLKRLNWLLARAPGYIAVAGGGARFAESDDVADVLDVLARRGLAFVELGASHLERAAAAAGLPYASALGAMGQDLSAHSIDEALADLEAAALAGGSALGVVPGYPVALARLRAWAATLDEKGLVLAPVSAVLIEQAGLVRGADGWPARRRPA